MGAEGPTNDLAQRLGAVDDEQPADLRVEPALDEIVDQGLDGRGVLRCALDEAKRSLVTPSVTAR
jgi:hypothetical protein